MIVFIRRIDGVAVDFFIAALIFSARPFFLGVELHGRHIVHAFDDIPVPLILQRVPMSWVVCRSDICFERTIKQSSGEGSVYVGYELFREFEFVSKLVDLEPTAERAVRELISSLQAGM